MYRYCNINYGAFVFWIIIYENVSVNFLSSVCLSQYKASDCSPDKTTRMYATFDSTDYRDLVQLSGQFARSYTETVLVAIAKEACR